MTQPSPVSLPPTLQSSVADGIAQLRLCRPAKRNALDAAMVEGIGRFFSNLPEEVRAVVLLAEGDHFYGLITRFDLLNHLRRTLT